MRFSFCGTVLVGWLIGGSAANAQGWTLSRVADSNSPVPGGGQFVAVGNPPFLSPSLGSSGAIAFQSLYNQGAQQGVFSNETGSLHLVANRATTAPGSPGRNFAGGFFGASLGGNSPVFVASDNTTGTGVYGLSAQGLFTVADASTPIPGGGGNFSAIAGAACDGLDTAFLAINTPSGGGRAGVFHARNGAINTVADRSTIVPGSGSTFDAFGIAVVGQGKVAFGASSSGRVGIYSRAADGSGPIIAQVDTLTSVPGGSGLFLDFPRSAFDGVNTAIIGLDDQTRSGVYARLNGQLVNIADTLTPGPGGIHFTGFGDVAVSGDSIAFTAGFNTSPFGALWVWRAGQLSRVVSVGDNLNGLTVASIYIGPESLKGDTIAFSFAEVNNGPNPLKGGVYTATIPAPATLALWAAAGVLAKRRRR